LENRFSRDSENRIWKAEVADWEQKLKDLDEIGRGDRPGKLLRDRLEAFDVEMTLERAALPTGKKRSIVR